jgi:hypothetical protein
LLTELGRDHLFRAAIVTRVRRCWRNGRQSNGTVTAAYRQATMTPPSARELRRAEAATSSCRSGLKLVDRASLPSKPVLDREGKHAKPDGRAAGAPVLE